MLWILLNVWWDSKKCGDTSIYFMSYSYSLHIFSFNDMPMYSSRWAYTCLPGHGGFPPDRLWFPADLIACHRTAQPSVVGEFCLFDRPYKLVWRFPGWNQCISCVEHIYSKNLELVWHGIVPAPYTMHERCLSKTPDKIHIFDDSVRVKQYVAWCDKRVIADKSKCLVR